MTTYSWLREDVVLAIHRRQLAEHGGEEGIRDHGLLLSALARPRNVHAYESPPPSLARLAASYAHGLVSNHPFVDGNKQTAYVACLLFLRLNGFRIDAPSEQKYGTFMALAEGSLSEEDLTSWIDGHMATQ